MTRITSATPKKGKERPYVCPRKFASIGAIAAPDHRRKLYAAEDTDLEKGDTSIAREVNEALEIPQKRPDTTTASSL